MTLLDEFSIALQGKDLDQLIHAAKADSDNRLLGQGITVLALFISEIMVDAMETSDRERFRQLFAPLAREPRAA